MKNLTIDQKRLLMVAVLIILFIVIFAPFRKEQKTFVMNVENMKIVENPVTPREAVVVNRNYNPIQKEAKTGNLKGYDLAKLKREYYNKDICSFIEYRYKIESMSKIKDYFSVEGYHSETPVYVHVEKDKYCNGCTEKENTTKYFRYKKIKDIDKKDGPNLESEDVLIVGVSEYINAVTATFTYNSLDKNNAKIGLDDFIGKKRTFEYRENINILTSVVTSERLRVKILIQNLDTGSIVEKNINNIEVGEEMFETVLGRELPIGRYAFTTYLYGGSRNLNVERIEVFEII